ncbi:MAG: class I SAM-dependent methyltransferase [Lachnospiraceae bacterium]|nr:class I SAM-dependent methyltransferase [Lachnospiraceae bacterium]
MRISDKWTDFEVIDTADGEKLERWDRYILVRPDPQVIWDGDKSGRLWQKADAHYHRSDKGGGSWEIKNLPERWTVSYRNLTFAIKPFSFKHTGLFPEQAVNWDAIRAMIGERTAAGREVKVLNLFAYTGGATLAAAAAGAKVTHVDASKGMVTWAKENAALSGLSDAGIRWLTDDCMKFVKREIRRENKYDAVILDPPSYGRGPGGEVWKLEKSIYPLLQDIRQLISEEPLFVLINSYTTGLQSGTLKYMADSVFTKAFGGCTEADETGLPVTSTGLVLPCGCSALWKAGDKEITNAGY